VDNTPLILFKGIRHLPYYLPIEPIQTRTPDSMKWISSTLIILCLLTACTSHLSTENSSLASLTPMPPISSPPGTTPPYMRPSPEPVPSTPPAPLPTPSFIAPLGLPPQTIKDYLASHVGVSAFGGKVFCSYEKLGASEDTANPRLLVWALCQEYYCQKSLDRGTGMSLPVVLFLQIAGSAYTITSSKIPGDGKQFGTDVKTLFPQDTWDSIFGKDVNTYNLRAQTLLYVTESDALTFFGLTSKGAPRPTYTPVQ
jgi:hypothetical protein